MQCRNEIRYCSESCKGRGMSNVYRENPDGEYKYVALLCEIVTHWKDFRSCFLDLKYLYLVLTWVGRYLPRY